MPSIRMAVPNREELLALLLEKGKTAGRRSQNVEENLLVQENARQIHRRLHALPEPYREVFTLRVFAELPYTQIGELFGKTENWARVTYYRAKQKIKEGL